MYLSVIGAASSDARTGEVGYRLGQKIASRGHVLVCGGLSGIMDAAAHGAAEAGGLSVGILPGPDRENASRWLSVCIPTGMGEARNALVARAGDAIIAVGGGFGTLSEIALGLKMGKEVIGIGSWELEKRGGRGMRFAGGPEEAVIMAEELLGMP